MQNSDAIAPRECGPVSGCIIPGRACLSADPESIMGIMDSRLDAGASPQNDLVSDASMLTHAV
jgi:hypothetical protein